MMTSPREWVVASWTLLVVGCGHDRRSSGSTDDAGPTAHTVEPGVCLGTHTDCSRAPTAETVEVGPLVTCDVVDHSADASVVWTAELGTIPCPEGACVPEIAQIVAGKDGSLWVESALVLPTHDAFANRFVGRALSRFGTQGEPSFSFVTHFRTPLAGDPPETLGMRVDARGHLLWVTSMAGRPGVELRDYDTKGKLVASRALVDLARSASAVIDDDGALTLAYGYEPARDSGSKDPNHALQAGDIARFDANGVPVWNQTVSALLWPDGPADRVALARKTIAMTHDSPADIGPAETRLAALDENGNIAWVREHEDASFTSLAADGDGSLTAVYGQTLPQDSPIYLARIDPQGQQSWNLDVSPSGSTSSLSGVSLDKAGRTFALSSKFGSEYIIEVVSPEGTTCGAYPLQAEACTSVGEGELDCFNPVIYPTEDGDLFFGAAGQVGLVHLGALP